jgi:hypothetical protein
MKEVTIVSATEWEGLFIDGKLVGENHSLGWDCLPERDVFSFRRIHANSKVEDILMEKGGFPESLETIINLQK